MDFEQEEWIPIVFNEMSYHYSDIRKSMKESQSFMLETMKKWEDYFHNKKITIEIAKQAIKSCMKDNARKTNFSPNVIEFSRYVEAAIKKDNWNSLLCSQERIPRNDEIGMIVETGSQIYHELKRNDSSLTWKQISAQLKTLVNIKRNMFPEYAKDALKINKLVLADLKTVVNQ